MVYSKYYFLNCIKFSWNCSLKFSRRQNLWNFTSVVSSVNHYASICIRAERLENWLELSGAVSGLWKMAGAWSGAWSHWSGMQQKGLERRSGKSARSAPLTCWRSFRRSWLSSVHSATMLCIGADLGKLLNIGGSVHSYIFFLLSSPCPNSPFPSFPSSQSSASDPQRI